MIKINQKSKIGRVFIGRFDLNDDLLVSLNNLCEKHGIRAGFVSVIGALKNVNLGFFNQKKRKYTSCINVKKKLEISSCTGNISLKDSKPFVHAHIVCSDHSGNTIGGHLMNNSRIFACEYTIFEITNASLIRKTDPAAGLPLWQII